MTGIPLNVTDPFGKLEDAVDKLFRPMHMHIYTGNPYRLSQTFYGIREAQPWNPYEGFRCLVTITSEGRREGTKSGLAVYSVFFLGKFRTRLGFLASQMYFREASRRAT